MDLQAGPRASPCRQLGFEVADDDDVLWADPTGKRLDPRNGPLLRPISRLQDDGDVTRPVHRERGRLIQPALVSQGTSEEGNESVGVESHRRAKRVVIGESCPKDEGDESSRGEKSQAEERSPRATPVVWHLAVVISPVGALWTGTCTAADGLEKGQPPPRKAHQQTGRCFAYGQVNASSWS